MSSSKISSVFIGVSSSLMISLIAVSSPQSGPHSNDLVTTIEAIESMFKEMGGIPGVDESRELRLGI